MTAYDARQIADALAAYGIVGTRIGNIDAYPSRDAMIDDLLVLQELDEGAPVRAGGLWYQKQAGATIIPDMPDFVPEGQATLPHFGAKALDPSFDNKDAIDAALASGLSVEIVNPLKVPFIFWTSGGHIISTGSQLFHNGPTDLVVIKQLPGSNSHMFSTEDFETLTGTQSSDCPTDFRLSGFAIDGNYLDNPLAGTGAVELNSSGSTLRVYGYRYTVEVDCNNSAGIGFYSEFNGSVPDDEGLKTKGSFVDVTTNITKKEGIVWRGPSDIVARRFWPVRAGWLPFDVHGTIEPHSDLYYNADYDWYDKIDGMVFDNSVVPGQTYRYQGSCEFDYIHSVGHRNGIGNHVWGAPRLKGHYWMGESCLAGFRTEPEGARLQVAVMDAHNCSGYSNGGPNKIAGALPYIDFNHTKQSMIATLELKRRANSAGWRDTETGQIGLRLNSPHTTIPAIGYDGGGASGHAIWLNNRYMRVTGTAEGVGTETYPFETNLLVNPRDLTEAEWTEINLVATPTTLIETAGSASRALRQYVAVEAGKDYVFSAVGKEIAGSAKRYLVIQFSATFGSTRTAKFDLTTGVCTYATAGLVTGVDDLGDDGYRCWITHAAVTTGTADCRIGLADLGNVSTVTYTGDGTSGLDVQRTRFEVGTVPMQYIITDERPSSALVRDATAAADVGNEVSLSVNNCKVAFTSIGAADEEMIKINGRLQAGQTAFVGDIPTSFGSQRWAVSIDVNGVKKTTRQVVTFQLDETITTQQTVVVNHNFLYKPDYRQVTISTTDSGAMANGDMTNLALNATADSTLTFIGKLAAASTGGDPRIFSVKIE